MAKGSDPELIRLPEEARDDLAVLIQNRQHLLPITRESAGDHVATSVTGFCARVAAKTGLKTALVTEIGLALWNLKLIQRELSLDSNALIDSLTNSLEVQTPEDWKEAHLRGWKESREELVTTLNALTDDHPLMISAKANTVAYTHQHLFLSARILTDVRGVFDTAGDKVLCTVIGHTLALYYADPAQDRKLMTIALDLEDIIALRKLCERAERKANVMAQSLKALNPVILPEKPKT